MSCLLCSGLYVGSAAERAGSRITEKFEVANRRKRVLIIRLPEGTYALEYNDTRVSSPSCTDFVFLWIWEISISRRVLKTAKSDYLSSVTCVCPPS